MYIRDLIQCSAGNSSRAGVHGRVCIISRVQLAIRVLQWVLFCSSAHCVPTGVSVMCYSDHYFVKGQKHFLIVSYTSVYE